MNKELDAAKSALNDAVNALDTLREESDDYPAMSDLIADVEAVRAKLDKLTAEPNPREKGDDDGVEYADPRDRD